MKNYYLEDGTKLTVDESKPLGSGGEGTIYLHASDPSVLLKIYKKQALKRSSDLEDKVRAMVEKKPRLLHHKGLTIIAWPQRLVYDSGRHFVGYLMSRVDAKNNLSHVITPGLQKKKFPKLTFYDRVVISINLALVMDYLHKNESVIGDINTSDFFVYPGLQIGVVDTDSFQVKNEDGKVYHCNVFTPDYTPPEVVRATKNKDKRVERTPNNDNYGLAILIFQTLMMGVHPFSARIKKPTFDGNAINYCMEKEIFPYHTSDPDIIPPKNAMPFSFFPKELQELFIKAFEPYKPDHERPTADNWVQSLRTLKESLKKCRKKKAHQYPDHFKKCPICLREKTKDHDSLQKHFTKISTLLVTYKTDSQPVVVKENEYLYQTLSGRVFKTKKRKEHALMFSEKRLRQYRLDKRIEKFHKDTPKALKPHVLTPEKLIYKDDDIVGYTFKAHNKLYKLTTFLKSTKFGKQKITLKTRVHAARKVASLFKTLEKLRTPVELHHLFIDEHQNILIPDIAFLKKSDEVNPVHFDKEAHTPQEHYYAKAWEKYQEELEAEEEEAAEAAAEETRVLDVPEEEEEDFAFEESYTTRVQQDMEEGLEVPPRVESYDEHGIETLRFALAVIIHQIIHKVHPFSGTFNGTEKPKSYFIEHNVYLHMQHTDEADISKKAILVEAFPGPYQRAMKKALHIEDPPHIKRPSPTRWERLLGKVERGLKACEKSAYHRYHRRMRSCSVCAEEQAEKNADKRAFYKEAEKRPVDYAISSNRLVNKGLLAAALLGLLFWVNTHGTIGVEALDAFADNLATIQVYFEVGLLFALVALIWVATLIVNIFRDRRISKSRRRLIWKNVRGNLIYASLFIVVGVFWL